MTTTGPSDASRANAAATALDDPPAHDQADARADERAPSPRPSERLERVGARARRVAVVGDLDHERGAVALGGRMQAVGAGGQRAAQQMGEQPLGLAAAHRGGRDVEVDLGDARAAAAQRQLELGRAAASAAPRSVDAASVGSLATRTRSSRSST